MGKGRIVSGGEDGLYTVELLHNRDRIDAELQYLAGRLMELQAEVDALNAERDVLVAERNAIATDIDTAVANAEVGNIPDVDALLVQLAQVSAQIQAQDVRIGMLEGRMLEANKRKQMLESVPADPQQQAWCADYTEDLTGEVATVEVPAEGVVGEFATWRRVQIRPGYEGRASYSAARDGQMLHREGQVGYQAYFNAAILPGVQRWRPQYRIGTITSINDSADTCSINLQSEDSSAQSLLIDPPSLQLSLTGVPIQYMNCDSDAFEVGDRVLVEFQDRDWNQPRVIGFEREPRPCLPRYLVLPVFPDVVPEYIPMPFYASDNETISGYQYYRGGTLQATVSVPGGFSDGRDYVNWSAPEGYNPDGVVGNRHDGGLIVYWNDLVFRWQDVLKYKDEVGGLQWDGAISAPQEFVNNKYVISKTGPSTFVGDADPAASFIDRLAGRWVRSIDTDTKIILLPQGDNPDPIHDGLELQALYRFDVNAWQEFVTGPLGDPVLRTHGDYVWEKLSEDPEEIFDVHLDAPAQISVPVSLGSAEIKTYSLHRAGWRPQSSVAGYRALAAVYVLEGEDPPTYAAGFWVG